MFIFKHYFTQCDDVIHQSHPLNYIKFDRTMQDIVYKLVPHLEGNEYKRWLSEV